MPGNHPPPVQSTSREVFPTQTKTSSINWRLFAQIVWGIFAVLAIAIIIAALPGYAAKFGGQLSHATGTNQLPGAHFFAAASGVASLVSAFISLGLSAVLFRQKFNEPIAMLLSFFLLFYGIVLGGPLEFAAASWLGSTALATTAQTFMLATPLIALLLLFPNGRFVPAWTRWVLLFSLPWNVGLLLLAPFDTESFNLSPILSFTAVVLYIGFGIVGLYAQIYRYLRAATNNERQQIRWAIYGFALWLTYVFISSIPYYYLTGLPPDAPTPWWGPASELGWWLSLNILPICLTIAITRYQLWDIDFVINRTLVYGTLTVGVLVLYVIIVGGLGLYFRAEDNIVLPLLATGLAAILFHPLRLRLQRGINRLMYGDRDEPFDILSRLGERLENTLSPEMVYPTIVETVSQALKLPYAAVNIWQNGQWETAESYGKPVSDPVIYPLNYQGESVGQLLVAQRSPGEAFSPADERILRNIARQAGAAVHAAQLVTDLQQSRHQLVTAREEERRRLRRDLHDGLGPHLASQTLTIDTIDKLLDRDPERARALLQDLKAQSQTAVKDIRRVVYNLRPPALDELGLIGALHEGAARQSQNDLRVSVEAPSQLPPLPAAVEVAAYRIVQEAVTNVVRHAQAHNCLVRLALEYPGKDTRLRVEVEDDGQGLPIDHLAGVGFQSMHERAAQLGGSCHIESVNGNGVRVTAVFPLPETQDNS